MSQILKQVCTCQGNGNLFVELVFELVQMSIFDVLQSWNPRHMFLCAGGSDLFTFLDRRTHGIRNTGSRTRKIEKFQLGATRTFRTRLRSLTTSFFDFCRQRSRFEKNTWEFESQKRYWCVKKWNSSEFLVVDWLITGEHQISDNLDSGLTRPKSVVNSIGSFS